ncbi:hypothetical protein KR074_004595 [Drosophila pseudoananassae]|nr:hypothetical protein KR074_004595 [Drosophila pseudoananassae]
MKFILIGLLTLSFITIVPGDLKTRHTNLKCDIPDTSYAEVKICRLKVLGRGKIGASVHLKMFKLPVKEISINFAVFKKLSGYHPFLFNVTVDLCHFLKHPNRLHVFYYFYGAMTPYLNLNKSCPLNVSIFEGDFILKDFVLSDQMFSKIPVPVGSYMFVIKMFTEHIWRGTITSYLDIYVDA